MEEDLMKDLMKDLKRFTPEFGEELFGLAGTQILDIMGIKGLMDYQGEIGVMNNPEKDEVIVIRKQKDGLVNGMVVHDFDKMIHKAEEYEAVEMYLDSIKAPRSSMPKNFSDCSKQPLSMVGRIEAIRENFEKLEIEAPKGFVNFGVGLKDGIQYFIADTNDSSNWDTFSVQLKKAKYKWYLSNTLLTGISSKKIAVLVDRPNN